MFHPGRLPKEQNVPVPKECRNSGRLNRSPSPGVPPLKSPTSGRPGAAPISYFEG